MYLADDMIMFKVLFCSNVTGGMTGGMSMSSAGGWLSAVIMIAIKYNWMWRKKKRRIVSNGQCLAQQAAIAT